MHIININSIPTRMVLIFLSLCIFNFAEWPQYTNDLHRCCKVTQGHNPLPSSVRERPSASCCRLMQCAWVRACPELEPCCFVMRAVVFFFSCFIFLCIFHLGHLDGGARALPTTQLLGEYSRLRMFRNRLHDTSPVMSQTPPHCCSVTRLLHVNRLSSLLRFGRVSFLR